MRIPLDRPEADYGKMKEFVESEQYSLSVDNEWYIQQGAESIKTTAPALLSRHWQAYVSQRGSFIASDNPVILEGEKRGPIGFTNAAVVFYPVSRHILLHGTRIGMTAAPLTEKLIARLNTLIMLNAHEQVFSSKPDFCWLDHHERYQTEWKLFDRDRF